MGFLQIIKDQTNFQSELIEKISFGEKYLGVLLKNGQIGVCATLGYKLHKELRSIREPDLSVPAHRIIFIAYANACINYQAQNLQENDIFDQIDFKRYGEIVMVGLFQSLLGKFKKSGIPISVFDIEKKNEELSDMKYQREFISKADALILTSTTLVNNTFNNIISSTHPNSHVFLLGPSGILTKEFFRFPQIKMVFGSLFERNDNRVLEVIEKGYGTKKFLPYLRKVFIKRNELL